MIHFSRASSNYFSENSHFQIYNRKDWNTYSCSIFNMKIMPRIAFVFHTIIPFPKSTLRQFSKWKKCSESIFLNLENMFPPTLPSFMKLAVHFSNIFGSCAREMWNFHFLIHFVTNKTLMPNWDPRFIFNFKRESIKISPYGITNQRLIRQSFKRYL